MSRGIRKSPDQRRHRETDWSWPGLPARERRRSGAREGGHCYKENKLMPGRIEAWENKKVWNAGMEALKCYILYSGCL